ncbi:TatD family hydrolase [Clostridium sp. 19966]|uniref:TatD family hydrolase n=1 Tax=Clostridium sp. 19966 TaxID=2768166 RepID=UPI0028E087BB|nr:TatD family hydrolase [Clostridium sp. 19966]MDT8717273.1 TatD family hydrolase [Clostridium sp. 19966]
MDIKIFDSHAHYDDEKFDEDREKVIEAIQKSGVIGVLNCGASYAGAKKSAELANTYDMFYAAIGIHPENAYELNEEVLNEFRLLAQNPKIRAVGEIGLDYYYEENPPRDIQKQAFINQMKLAEELKLPVVIHDRDAHEDTLNIIKQFPKVNGVVHCFSGSVEFAKQCLKEGYYIGITGVVTFKNAKKIVEVVREVPMDKILVETDCPYMAPTPNRGKRNQSDYIIYVMEKIAEIKEVTVEEISSNTIKNVKNLLNLK